MSLKFALAAALLASCGQIPKDPEKTSELVAERDEVRIGFVAGEYMEDQNAMRALAGDVASAAGARLVPVYASAETLLGDLEAGRLELVVGKFAKASPWSKRVTFTAAFPRPVPSSKEPAVRGAVRMGENRWLITVDRAIRERPAE